MALHVLIFLLILAWTDCNENVKTSEVHIIGPGADRIVELFLGKAKCNRNKELNTATKACKVSMPNDCSELGNGKCDSGVYKVYPKNSPGFDVYCKTDDDPGWTVIQRRLNGNVDFYRNWKSYKYGFGKLNEEFWLGNENIHQLTSQGKYMLRIDIGDFENEKRYAEYSNFKVDNEKSGYKLTVSGYKGNAGDSLANHNGQKFTTRDRDNDHQTSFNCAVHFTGAWWYNSCYYSNLNGQYMVENHKKSGGKGISWSKWHGDRYSLKKSEMKVRKA